jgi:hypothetical protein
MEYLQYEFSAKRGDSIEVTLDHAANVQLLDPSNFAAYKAGRQYRYHGGHVTTSPYRIGIPSDGTWFVVIDLGGRDGSVRASARLLSSAGASV